MCARQEFNLANQAVAAASPFGLTVPLSVAPVRLRLLAANVMTLALAMYAGLPIASWPLLYLVYFAVEVTEVREASAEELEHGHVHGAGGHHH